MNSYAYWQKREAEALNNYIKDEAEFDRQIKSIYKSQLNAIDGLINEFYGRYASSEGITIAEAKKRVSRAEIERFEKKAEKYVAQRNFSKKANEEMRLYNATMRINRLEMLKANIGLELIAGHDELEKYMAGILKGRTEEELERQAGILGKTIKNNAALANVIPNASFHNARFSDRVWQYQDLLKADLSKALQTGLIQGKNPRALTKDIKKYFVGADGKGGVTYAVERLMRTELARVQTEAQKQSFEKNGFSKYMFIVNGGCCPICEEVKNKATKYGNGVYLVEKMMPGENAPPMHPHCRCSVAAYETDDEYNKWLDFLANGGTTEEYKKQKTKPKAKKEVAKPAKSDKIASKYGFGIIEGEHTAFDDAKVSNPNYNKGDRNYHINCQRCCPAYEMRRRGYDVEALPRKSGNDTVAHSWQNVFKDAKWLRTGKNRGLATRDAIVDIVNNYGNGARVEIYVQWKHGSAHVFMAENIDGKVHFIDPQTGNGDVAYYFEYIKPTKTLICRLDELEPTDLIKGCCK